MISEKHRIPSAPVSRPARRKVVRRIGKDAFDEVSGAEAMWGNRLLQLLGAPVPGERLLEALGDYLENLVGQPHDVFFHSLRSFSGTQFQSPAEPYFSTTFMLAPDPRVGMLSADVNLVQGWLDTLLEDEPTEVRKLLPMTPRDFGLVSYLLMELVNWLCQRGLPPISIAANPPNLDVAEGCLRSQSELVEAVYAVTSPISAGLVRLFLPSAMVQSMETFVTREHQLNRQRRRLIMSRLGALKTRLCVEAARVELADEEYTTLGRGDVLLFDKHGFRQLKTAEEGPESAAPASTSPAEGRAYLAGNDGDYLRCTICPGGVDGWQVNFTDPMPVSPPGRPSKNEQLATQKFQKIQTKENSMASEELENQGQSAVQSVPLIEKPHVDVQVCMGAVTLPIATLAQLQSGYVLELDKRIEDGVDLVVDGTLIGRGELVWVEERLGVRILSFEA